MRAFHAALGQATSADHARSESTTTQSLLNSTSNHLVSLNAPVLSKPIGSPRQSGAPSVCVEA